MTEPLAPAEFSALDDLQAFSNKIRAIVGSGVNADADIREAVAHVHILQQFVMSQAAARAYPDRFRLLGESLS